MTANDLIEALEAIVKDHGDMPVILSDDSRLCEILACDADGGVRGKRVEIVLRGRGESHET
jgi:hypothetical protein